MNMLRKSHMATSAELRMIALATALLLLGSCVGCGRQTVEGKVTLDGRPLEQGYITFRPKPDTEGPGAGAPIEQGDFLIEGLDDPLDGSYRVEITAKGKTGQTTVDGTGRRREAEGQILPARYNTQSTLEAEVKPGQRNEFTFPLVSK